MTPNALHQGAGWVENLLHLHPLSGHPRVPCWGQEGLSTRRFWARKRVGCCATPEMRTWRSWGRWSVHVLTNLTREGLLPAGGQRVLGIPFPHRLGALGVDACPLLPPAPKSQGTSTQERVFGTRDFNSVWLKSFWSSRPAVPSPTHPAEIAMVITALWRGQGARGWWRRKPGSPRWSSSLCSPIWRRNLKTCLQQPGFCACRGKTARVINYEEFKKALEELAPKRFKDKSKEEAYEAICQLVAGKEPINVGVTVSAEPLGRWEQEGWSGGEDGALPAAQMLSEGWGLHGSSVRVRSLHGARDEGDGACS